MSERVEKVSIKEVSICRLVYTHTHTHMPLLIPATTKSKSKRQMTVGKKYWKTKALMLLSETTLISLEEILSFWTGEIVQWSRVYVLAEDSSSRGNNDLLCPKKLPEYTACTHIQN